VILTYDLRSVDQTMNDSPFYVMWMVGLEVQITTSMNRFPVNFHGQFWTYLHDQNVQEREDMISLKFRCEIYGRCNPVEMVKKLLVPSPEIRTSSIDWAQLSRFYLNPVS
jgi:hypothetical protein